MVLWHFQTKDSFMHNFLNQLKLRQMTVLDKNHVFFCKKSKNFFNLFPVFIVLSDKLFHGWDYEF